MWRDAPVENCTLRFGPKNFVPFRDVDLDFGGLHMLEYAS